MPLPTPLPTPAAPTPRRRGPGRIGRLVLTAFALAALTAVTGHTVAVCLLVAATAVLGVAAALAVLEHWAAAAPTEPAPLTATAVRAVRETVPDDDDSVNRQLRRLHAAHVEKVNLALDGGRDQLARELSDDYADQALALLTSAS
jgi:hypothetical protein